MLHKILHRLLNGTLTPKLYRYATILHELVHLYYEKTNNPDETYDLQDCIDLDTKASTLNAQNFAYYASGALL